MKRIQNWPLILADFLQSRKDTPFEWGKHDCCLFAADAIEAITGEDMAHGLRIYTSELEAEHVLAQYGGVAGVADTITARFGVGEVDANYAKRGDLILIDGQAGHTLGIMSLDSKPVGVAQKGFTKTHRRNIIKAWSID